MPIFDSEFLKRLEYLSLVSRRVFRGQLLAKRRSKQLGTGIEFSDHREYTAGDDLRYVDWNVYARHGDVLLKRFQEEKDLHVYILLDISRSMQHGAIEKFDYARRVAAALAYIALADMDRVSILAYADEIFDTMPLTRGKDRILSVFRFLESLQVTGTATRLAHVVHSLVHQAPRPGIAIIISDLFDHDGFRGGADLLRHHRFEPHIVQICAVEEAKPTQLGDMELQEVETGQCRQVTISERDLRQYQVRFQHFLDSIATYCRTHAFSYTYTTTELPFDELILGMMKSSGIST